MHISTIAAIEGPISQWNIHQSGAKFVTITLLKTAFVFVVILLTFVFLVPAQFVLEIFLPTGRGDRLLPGIIVIFFCLWAANRVGSYFFWATRLSDERWSVLDHGAGTDTAESFLDLGVAHAPRTRVDKSENRALPPLAIDVSAAPGPLAGHYFGRERIPLALGIGRSDPMTSAVLGLLTGCGAMVASAAFVLAYRIAQRRFTIGAILITTAIIAVLLGWARANLF